MLIALEPINNPVVLTGKLDISGGNMTGQLTTSSTMTIQGNAFSVGTSTFVIKGGNVGIGTTDTTNYKLRVNGIFRCDNYATIANQLYLGSNTRFYPTGFDFQTTGVIRTNNNTTPVTNLFLDINGNVGIGTTNPASLLNISSGTIRMDGTGSPTTGGALCLNSSGVMSKCTSQPDASGNCTCP